MAIDKERNAYPMETYEESRLRRYRKVEFTPTTYTREAFEMAYQTWAMKSPNQNREHEWNIYCDVRDGVNLGTNEKLMDYQKNGRQELTQ